ncbi:MAG TPA: hypothetical protein PL045_01480 [Chitinophagaceae bacterium]|nr:hypothetical protein [Chitinophagaceae bacterium]
MQLAELENSVLQLSISEYEKFREWFLEYENERWDKKIEKDISEKKLEALANSALKDFKEGNYKVL